MSVSIFVHPYVCPYVSDMFAIHLYTPVISGMNSPEVAKCAKNSGFVRLNIFTLDVC